MGARVTATAAEPMTLEHQFQEHQQQQYEASPTQVLCQQSWVITEAAEAAAKDSAHPRHHRQYPAHW